MNNSPINVSVTVECADPNVPIEKCLNCEATIYTCERTVAIYNSYTCPVHKDGFETVDGNWFCNSQCYNQYFNVENK